MKNIKAITLILLIFISSCNKDKELNRQLTYEELETEIRKDQDNRAVFYYSDYERLLQTIKNKNCVVLPLYKLKDFNDTSKIIVGLRHDVDCHPFKALEIAEIEAKYGFNSTFYILPTAKYYGYLNKDTNLINYTCLDHLYKKIYDLGNEIGMHNDLLTVMIKWGKEPEEFNNYQILYFKLHGIPIYGSSAHGSSIAVELNTLNFEIFKEFKLKDFVEYNGKKYPLGIDSMKNFGFEYEAYHIDYNIYMSDAGGYWKTKNGNLKIINDSKIPEKDLDFEQVIATIQNAKHGDRIVILTHPVWWGKK